MQNLNKVFNRIGQLGVGLAIAGTVIPSIIYNVDGGKRAIIFDRFAGVKDKVIGEGTHFIIPWVQKPIIFDVRSQVRNVPVVTGSKGVDYDDRVLPSITNEVLKAVIAQFDASELITQRALVSQRVSQELIERAGSFGILLDDISLAEQQKNATIISAQGDSEAAVLISKAIGAAGEGIVELRRIEAAEEIAFQLSKNRNISFLPPGNKALLNLPPV